MPVDVQDVAVLREKHAALDRIIRDEEQRLWPNQLEIRRMKLEKLHLKERIDGIMAERLTMTAQ